MKTNNILDIFLKPYKKDCQFLQSFKLVDNKGVGMFKTNSDFYSVFEKGNHFTAVELQVCLNQLLYTYFGYIGLFDYVENIDDENKLLNIQKENTFITEQSVHFKKEIQISDEIVGEIQITKAKKIGNLTLMECNYKFGDGCFGMVKVALKDSNNKSIEKILQAIN